MGEHRPTKITLQFADHSIKKPVGEIEDVLIKVGQFIYPVDFIVLETQPVNNPMSKIPLILGRPFLATSNALINCRNGSMKISFGNMTLDLNIFNLKSNSNESCNQTLEVNAIHENSENKSIDLNDEREA